MVNCICILIVLSNLALLRNNVQVGAQGFDLDPRGRIPATTTKIFRSEGLKDADKGIHGEDSAGSLEESQADETQISVNASADKWEDAEPLPVPTIDRQHAAKLLDASTHQTPSLEQTSASPQATAPSTASTGSSTHGSSHSALLTSGSNQSVSVGAFSLLCLAAAVAEAYLR